MRAWRRAAEWEVTTGDSHVGSGGENPVCEGNADGGCEVISWPGEGAAALATPKEDRGAVSRPERLMLFADAYLFWRNEVSN